MRLPCGFTLISSPVQTDIALWDDFDGEVPNPATFKAPGVATFIIHDFQEWDGRDVLDLEALGKVTEERFPALS